jgi:hypothetical protein
MIDIEFSNHGRARVWVDELPPVERLSNDVSWHQESFADAKGQAFHKRVVVELFQPFGATFHYGLLGAELQENGSNELFVSVPTDSPSLTIPYVGALAAKVDEVVMGSMPEFADAILTSLRHLPAELLPSGQLTFTYMAHGAVGSARVVFEKLATAAVRLLMKIDAPRGEDEMLEILQGA